MSAAASASARASRLSSKLPNILPCSCEQEHAWRGQWGILSSPPEKPAPAPRVLPGAQVIKINRKTAAPLRMARIRGGRGGGARSRDARWCCRHEKNINPVPVRKCGSERELRRIHVPAGPGGKLCASPRCRRAGWGTWAPGGRRARRRAAWRPWPSSRRGPRAAGPGHGRGAASALGTARASGVRWQSSAGARPARAPALILHRPRTRDAPGQHRQGTGGETLRCPGARRPRPRLGPGATRSPRAAPAGIPLFPRPAGLGARGRSGRFSVG